MAVVTRISLASRAWTRFAELIEALKQEIANLTTTPPEHYSFQPQDKTLLYDICVVIDSLYFEVQSCFVILRCFVIRIGRKILGLTISDKDVEPIIQAAGVDTSWIKHVYDARALFFHETAPWIALQVHQRGPLHCSLLVMRENLFQFDDPAKFVTELQMREALECLKAALPPPAEWASM